jgi:4-hydroxy-tetrahydrodipicolinate reductase
MAPTQQSMHKVAVAGASGRMGHMLIEAIRASDDCQLAGALDIASSPSIGNDAAAFLGHASGVAISADARAALANAKVLIDFTRPEGTLAYVKACRELGVNAVIGTTGFHEGQKEQIEDAARDIAIVMAPNMSVGVNVTLKLLEMAAKALSTGYDIEIVEAHHRAKRDAPSGTALTLADALAEASGRDLAAAARYARHGDIGARSPNEIGIQTLRGGDVVGDHTVMFLGNGDRLEVTHRASTRDTFAVGAVRAALWVIGCQPGLYDMRNVLGLGL